MTFDVFLSHNSDDKTAVKTLGAALKRRGLKVWLDEWELRPGTTWQDALEDIVTGCKSATVCFGGSGIGPWEEPEMRALLKRFLSEKKIGNVVPIIPVLLPGAPPDVKLPVFLEAFTWVDLRHGLTAEGLERLKWGITGKKPLENAPTVCLAKVTPDLRRSRETVANYLASSKINVIPDKAYTGAPSTFLPELKADLDQADVFVQVLGENYADRTEELPEGEELAQFRRAKESGKVILQWRDKSVDLDRISDPPHLELVDGADVICNDLTEFAKLVAERAARVHEIERPVIADGQQWLALMKADKPDEDVANEVCHALKTANVNCRVTRTGKSLVETLREIPYDAVLIVYGCCSDDWLEERGDELMAVDLNLKDQAPVRAYYVCVEKARLPYHGKGVLEIKRRDNAGWQQLMAAIRERGGRL
ncbi:MAG: toll/interleukin-1 receptor domain-containing protein [Candidatus Accumulibacter meliphilus]|jgi:ribosome-binding factor A|uniref:toll/interleukin-1 receptor domain-containing protein n=1 Tax=Candidatus Accumulibacter meliphilus TaxID=2211374 RepID=UPI002FC34418